MPDAAAHAQPDPFRIHRVIAVHDCADSLGDPFDHPEYWCPEDGTPAPVAPPDMPKWKYYQRYGGLARTVAEERGDFDTPEAKASGARRDRAAREFWGVKPEPRLVRQRRAPLAIQRRRVHRERRPGVTRVARRRSSAASRDGPDDSDPHRAIARAAGVIAAAGVNHTFAELRFLLGPLFSPAEALQVFSLLPSEAEEEAWAQ
jgi:hypothetical protein